MDRLTKKELGDTDGEKFVLCNHKEEDCNDSCQYGTCEWNRKALLQLKKYEDLEEQGKLLKPPCKVGDVTYSVRKSHEEIIVAVVERIEIDEGGNWVITSYEDSHRFEDFGKTVFLIKEEAEAARRALKG